MSMNTTKIRKHPLLQQILVGYTQVGHRELVFVPNNTKRVSHPNMGVGC